MKRFDSACEDLAGKECVGVISAVQYEICVERVDADASRIEAKGH